MSFLVSDYGITSESQDALLSSRMLFQILGMGIAVPVTEELIFRGLVYRKLERYVSVKKAVLLGAAIFGGLSWQSAADPVCFSDGDHPESALPSI